MKNLLLLLFFTTASIQCYGQAALGISTLGLINFKDTVQLETSLDVELYVKNIGDEAYSGPLAVNFVLGDISFIMKGRENVTDFEPADSQKIKFSIPFNEFTSEPGSHIIVVWPTGSSIKTRDTIIKKVEVLDPSSVKNSIGETAADRVSLFPNPAASFVTLKMDASLLQPDQIRITDVQGRSYDVRLGAKSTIDVSVLPEGLYYIQIIFRDGRAASKKLVIIRP